jgi:hypothetical protein
VSIEHILSSFGDGVNFGVYRYQLLKQLFIFSKRVYQVFLRFCHRPITSAFYFVILSFEFSILYRWLRTADALQGSTDT